MAIPLVIDSGIAVKWIIEEHDSVAAERILDAYSEREIVLYAPDLIFSEIGNVLWRKVTFEGVSSSDANDAIDSLNEILIQTIPSFSIFESAFAIAVEYRRTFYDLIYLAASLHLGCSFVTADVRLFNAVQPKFPNIVLLSDWPK